MRTRILAECGGKRATEKQRERERETDRQTERLFRWRQLKARCVSPSVLCFRLKCKKKTYSFFSYIEAEAVGRWNMLPLDVVYCKWLGEKHFTSGLGVEKWLTVVGSQPLEAILLISVWLVQSMDQKAGGHIWESNMLSYLWGLLSILNASLITDWK